MPCALRARESTQGAQSAAGRSPPPASQGRIGLKLRFGGGWDGFEANVEIVVIGFGAVRLRNKAVVRIDRLVPVSRPGPRLVEGTRVVDREGDLERVAAIDQ